MEKEKNAVAQPPVAKIGSLRVSQGRHGSTFGCPVPAMQAHERAGIQNSKDTVARQAHNTLTTDFQPPPEDVPCPCPSAPGVKSGRKMDERGVGGQESGQQGQRGARQGSKKCTATLDNKKKRISHSPGYRRSPPGHHPSPRTKTGSIPCPRPCQLPCP